MKPIINKAARFEYDIIETYEAGMVLYGHEAKSIRIGQASLKGSFVRVIKGEAFLHNMHIHPYKFAQLDDDYDPTHTRKLLLKKKEILKLEQLDQRKGVALVPLKIISSGRRFKVVVGAGRGRKQYQKKEVLKQRDVKREMERDLKDRGRY